MCGETFRAGWRNSDQWKAQEEQWIVSKGQAFSYRIGVSSGFVFFQYQGISGERGLTWPLGRVRQWGCWLKSVCSAVTTNLQIFLSRRWHKLASTCSPEHPAPKQRWHLYGPWHCRAEEPEPGQGQLEQQPGRDTRRCSLLATRPSWAVQCLSSGPPLCRGNFTALTQYWASSTWLTWSDTV